VPILVFVRKLAAPALLLVLNCLPANAQTTADAIKTRLVGQPLYLRGCWMDDDLKFNADGQPEKGFHPGPFTEAGIDVRKVKLSHGQLQIEGQRVVLEFHNMVPTRINIHSANYAGSVSIKIQSPPNGDFSKALDAVFAPDLASLVPSMPFYWQNFARTHILTPGEENASIPPQALASGDKPLQIGGAVTKPVVLQQPSPQFSQIARALKFSGAVMVHLWLMQDGTPSHISVVEPAGLGLDEQALLAVSQYRFQPAMKDGKPVTVDLYVNVNFQIL
jgi:TonB family protein